MLSTIPPSILKDTLILYVPTVFDRYQEPQNVIYTVNHVHIQADNKTVNINTQSGGMNTEVTLKGMIFVDARLSSPKLDFEALQEQAQAAGGVCTCHVKNRAGKLSRLFTVQTVDGLPDDDDNLHHWELGVT